MMKVLFLEMFDVVVVRQCHHAEYTKGGPPNSAFQLYYAFPKRYALGFRLKNHIRWHGL